MRFRRLLAFVVMTIFGLISLVSVGVATEKNQANEEKRPQVLEHIFFVVVEGVSDKDLRATYTPNISGIASSGVSCNTVSVLPPTGNFLSALLTGITPFSSGGGLETEAGALTLPKAFKDAGRQSCIIYDGKHPLPRCLKDFKKLMPEKKQDSTTIDEGIIDLTLETFKEKEPFFTTVVLPGTEYIRNNDTSQETIAKTITRADEQIGRLLTELRKQGLYENTLLVVTGSTTEKSITMNDLDSAVMVPLVMSGPGLKIGAAIAPSRIVDITPTVAMLSGVMLNKEADGLVLWNALLAGEGFSEGNLLQKRLNELSDVYVNAIKGIYKLGNEKSNIHIAKEKINKEKKSIERMITEREQEISGLKLKIALYKIIGVVFLVISFIGYAVEYFVLRKKFLMF